MATDYELKILDPVTGGTVTQLFDTINSNSKHIEKHALKDGAIETAQLKDKAVTTAKINDNAVTTAKIDDGAITSNKLNLDSDITNTMIDMLFPIGAYYWSSVDLSHNQSGSRGPLDHGTWIPVEGKMLFAAGSVQVTKGTYQKTFDFKQGAKGGSVYVDFSKSADTNESITMFNLVKGGYGLGLSVGYGGLVVIGHGANTSIDSEKIYDGFYTDQGVTRLTAPSNMPPYEVAYCWHRTG